MNPRQSQTHDGRCRTLFQRDSNPCPKGKVSGLNSGLGRPPVLKECLKFLEGEVWTSSLETYWSVRYVCISYP